MNLHTNLNSSLKTAQGLGSSKTGTHHWLQQRITAIALIPIILWFVVVVIRLVNASLEEVLSILYSPLNVLMLIMMISVGLYHGLLGVKVIIEDYVHNKCCKLVMLILVQFITVFTACSGLLAVLAFYFN